jgi:hypothetical protein
MPLASEIDPEVEVDGHRYVRTDVLAIANADLLTQAIEADTEDTYLSYEVRDKLQEATSYFLAIWSMLHGGVKENDPLIKQQINGTCAALVEAYKMMEGRKPKSCNSDHDRYTEVK